MQRLVIPYSSSGKAVRIPPLLLLYPRTATAVGCSNDIPPTTDLDMWLLKLVRIIFIALFTHTTMNGKINVTAAFVGV